MIRRLFRTRLTFLPLRKTAFLLIAAPLLLAGACSKVPAGESRVPAASDEPVGFAVGGQTKGKTPLTTLPALAGQDFSVSAWYSPDGGSFQSQDVPTVKYFENHRFGYIKGATEDDSYANHVWQGVARSSTNALSPDLVYWPLDGTLSFFCYAPYRTGDADIVLEAPVTDDAVIARLPDYLPGSPLIRVTPAEAAADQADFLCAPPLLDRSRFDEAGAFPLDFSKHRMTQVEFGFNYEGTLDSSPGVEESVRVLSIAVKNIIGSRYMYYTQTAPAMTGSSWSMSVSPADPADGAAFPTADYTLQAAQGELKTYPAGGLPAVTEPRSNNYEIVSTDKGRLFLLPQTLPADARLEISYGIIEVHGVTKVLETITWNLADGTLSSWPEGKRVRYLFTIDIPERGVVAASAEILDWKASGNEGPSDQELIY